MARKPEAGTEPGVELVHVVPREGLHFPSDEVFAQEVTAEEAAALVATGAYVIPEPEPAGEPEQEDTDAGTR